MKFTKRNGAIRFVDGTSTSYYLDIDFENADLNAPFGTPLTEELLHMNRGVMDSDAHYVQGPDDPMMAPLPMTLSVTLTDGAHTQNVLDWITALNDGGSTTVNSNTVATTESDTQRDGSNNNPAFANSNKLTCNVEAHWNTSGTDLHFIWAEVCFPRDQVQIAESDDGVNITLNGMIYGTITYNSSALNGDTDIEA